MEIDKMIAPILGVYTAGLLFASVCLNIIQEKSSQHKLLLDAMCEVESGCDPDVIGDNGNAIGPYQIWEVYWTDAIEHDSSIGGQYSDCMNKEYAEKVIFTYWDRYATEERLEHIPTDEDRARIHNGGPNGHKKESTVKYWKKVQKCINR